jgi:hypothetical protein
MGVYQNVLSSISPTDSLVVHQWRAHRMGAQRSGMGARSAVVPLVACAERVTLHFNGLLQREKCHNQTC